MSSLETFETLWRRSDEIFSYLAPGAIQAQPISLRQPFLFYLGHLPAFAWAKIGMEFLSRPAFAPDFDVLFARGIDPTHVDAYDSGSAWPPVSEVLAYRDRIRDVLRKEKDRLAEPDALQVMTAIAEHECMHQETLLYMVRELGLECVRPPQKRPEYLFKGASSPGEVAIQGGAVTLGLRQDPARFAWDNEFPEYTVEVEDFVVDRTPVRNGEYLDFMEAGGYSDRSLWRAEDWTWRERLGIESPRFWRRDSGRWLYRALFDELPLEDVLDWPVSVSWAEARAFAASRSSRLLTEAEYHKAARGSSRVPVGNFGFRHWSPVPVGLGASGGPGPLDLVGNGWEWTATVFGPYPGFEPMALYPLYSKDFFEDEHFVLRGASWVTDDRLVRPTFRNWFQPRYPFVFSKFRCARSR